MPDFVALLQILMIDLSLAGDNAIAVGMAAAGLPATKRHRAVVIGIVVATVLRIVLAFLATQLLHIPGLLALGGATLCWVAWKMYQGIRRSAAKTESAGAHASPVQDKTLSSALVQIILADVSMSLDNVLAVAGVARDHLGLLVIGLTVSVLLMGVAATWVARLIARHSWVAYVGLVVLVYTALHMLWDGSQILWHS